MSTAIKKINGGSSEAAFSQTRQGVQILSAAAHSAVCEARNNALGRSFSRAVQRLGTSVVMSSAAACIWLYAAIGCSQPSANRQTVPGHVPFKEQITPEQAPSRPRQESKPDSSTPQAPRADPATLRDVVWGVVLPQTGPEQSIGTMFMQGLQYAHATTQSATRRVQLRSRDVYEGATDAHIRSLVEQEQAQLIFGPADVKNARVAGNAAGALHTPIVTFTTERGITKLNPYVFRSFFSVEGELEALVLAARQRQAQRFGVVFPSTQFGRTAKATYAEVLRAQSSSVVYEHAYAKGQANFTEELIDATTGNFDALLLSDSAIKVGLIAAALAHHGIWSSAATERGRKVNLLLLSLAFEPTILDKVTRYIQGALFSVPYHPALGSEEAAAFSKGFEEQFGRKPDVFAAFAYDAYRMALTACEQSECTAESLRNQLTGFRASAESVGPNSGFSAQRNPLHETRVFELIDRTYQSVGLAGR